MEIDIEISETMTSGVYGNENRYVRISKKLREEYNIELYSFINLEAKNNCFVCLQVFPAYTEDVEKACNSLFVTRSTYLILEKTESKGNVVIDTTEQISLGCDPEMLLVRDGKEVVRCSSFFKKEGDVGNDGFALELRPLPGIAPEAVTNTLYSLIKKARRMINSTVPQPERVRMVGTSFIRGPNYEQYMKPTQGLWNTTNTLPYYTTGFHLHFGIPIYLLRAKEPDIRQVINYIIRVLDFYVGVPSIVLEEAEENQRRSNITIGYGKPGDYRLNYTTLEYRVPGGFNLRHPMLSCGLIGMGATVVEDVFYRLKHYTSNFKRCSILDINTDLKKIYPNIPSKEDIFRLIMAPTTTHALSYTDNIYKDLSSMLTFSSKEQSINDYFNLISQRTKINKDIETNWENYYEHKHCATA